MLYAEISVDCIQTLKFFEKRVFRSNKERVLHLNRLGGDSTFKNASKRKNKILSLKLSFSGKSSFWGNVYQV